MVVVDAEVVDAAEVKFLAQILLIYLSGVLIPPAPYIFPGVFLVPV